MGKGLQYTFLKKKKKDLQIVIKHTKRCSMSLGIKEMQTKITISYHFTSIRMPTLNSNNNNNNNNTESNKY